MKSYKITKGILDELFSNDAEYMNVLAQMNVMDTEKIYNRLKVRHASLEVTAILGLVQEVSERLPEGYTTDYAQVKRWLTRRLGCEPDQPSGPRSVSPAYGSLWCHGDPVLRYPGGSCQHGSDGDLLQPCGSYLPRPPSYE